MAKSDQTSTVKSKPKKIDLVNELMLITASHAQKLTVKQLKELIKKHA